MKRFDGIVMSIQDRDKQKAELEKTLQKFTELLPSVNPEPSKIEEALVIINGTAKSRTAVLLAGELNRYFGTKIDVICFYTEQETETTNISKESYEDALAFAYEHLRSEDFEIKGQVVENVEMLKTILNNVLESSEYDIIIVPSSFIGIKEIKTSREEEEEDEAKVSLMGDIFEYLLEDVKDTPIMLVQSEKVNIDLLWRNTCIFFSSSTQISYLIEKALKFTLKKGEIHCLINIDPSYHEDKSEEELEELISKNKEELERFERANLEVFKEASRYVNFSLIATDQVDVFKKELVTFGKDVGVLMIYMPTKHSSLYGFFVDLLEDSEITVPIVIAKRKITPKKEFREEEKEIAEGEEEEEIKRRLDEKKEEEEEKFVIDEEMKETIKEEIKKDILGKEEEKEKKKEIKEEKKAKIPEEVIKEKKDTVKEKEEEVEMNEINEIKEEVKEEVIEEIKKEVKKEIKGEPKREVKKEVSKELKKEESMEELKDTILEEIREEIKEEIKYELKKDLKEPKKELKEKVIEEIKEEKKEEVAEKDFEEEEEEEVTSRMEFE